MKFNPVRLIYIYIGTSPGTSTSSRFCGSVTSTSVAPCSNPPSRWWRVLIRVTSFSLRYPSNGESRSKGYMPFCQFWKLNAFEFFSSSFSFFLPVCFVNGQNYLIYSIFLSMLLFIYNSFPVPCLFLSAKTVYFWAICSHNCAYFLDEKAHNLRLLSNYIDGSISTKSLGGRCQQEKKKKIALFWGVYCCK